jgi:hypothetical protein
MRSYGRIKLMGNPIKLLSILIIISSCASTPETLNSWVGKSEDNLITEFGIPTATYTLNNGTKLIEYKKLYGVGGQNHCTKTFIINKNGIVESWKKTGYSCSR